MRSTWHHFFQFKMFVTAKWHKLKSQGNGVAGGVQSNMFCREPYEGVQMVLPPSPLEPFLVVGLEQNGGIYTPFSYATAARRKKKGWRKQKLGKIVMKIWGTETKQTSLPENRSKVKTSGLDLIWSRKFIDSFQPLKKWHCMSLLMGIFFISKAILCNGFQLHNTVPVLNYIELSFFWKTEFTHLQSPEFLVFVLLCICPTWSSSNAGNWPGANALACSYV